MRTASIVVAALLVAACSGDRTGRGPGTGGAGGGVTGGDGGDGGGGGPPGAPFIDRIEPPEGPVGIRIVVHGGNFVPEPARNRIRIGAGEERIRSVDRAGTTIEATVPLEATTGPLVLFTGDLRVEGPTFTVLPDRPPEIHALVPDVVETGTTGLVSLQGRHFLPSARARVDGTEVRTRHESDTALRIEIDRTLLTAEGVVDVVVQNDPPGGLVSGSRPLRVADPYHLVAAVSLSVTSVRLEFDRPPDAARAADPAMYQVRSVLGDAFPAVERATLGADPRHVLLTTGPQPLHRTYLVDVSESLPSQAGGRLRATQGRFRPVGSGPEHRSASGTPGCGPGQLSGPGGIVAFAGGLLAVERTGHQVQLFAADGSPAGFLGHDGTAAGRHEAADRAALGCPGSTGSSLDGAFRLPRGAVAILPDGTRVVGDTGNGRVQRWSAEGAHVGLVGSGWTHPVVLGAVGGLACVADADDRIRCLDADGGEGLALGTGPGAGPGELGLAVALGETPSLARSADDVTVYVAEPGNHRVQRFLAGEPSGFIGGGAPGWQTDGSCCAASDGPGRFDRPAGVAVDPAGGVWVVDAAGGGRLQAFDAAGVHVLEMPLGYLPGGLAIDFEGGFWITEPAGDAVHRYR